MLKGIASCISPELLLTLHKMGHGDEIVLADAHFPGHTVGQRVLRADGLTVTALLEGILPLFELDSYAMPLRMMAVVEGDTLDEAVESDYLAVVHRHVPECPRPLRVERMTFYEDARRAYAVVMTGETRKYGNLLLKKGVTPVA
jgi:L-fucose mutarotase